MRGLIATGLLCFVFLCTVRPVFSSENNPLCRWKSTGPLPKESNNMHIHWLSDADLQDLESDQFNMLRSVFNLSKEPKEIRWQTGRLYVSSLKQGYIAWRCETSLKGRQIQEGDLIFGQIGKFSMPTTVYHGYHESKRKDEPTGERKIVDIGVSRKYSKSNVSITDDILRELESGGKLYTILDRHLETDDYINSQVITELHKEEGGTYRIHYQIKNISQRSVVIELGLPLTALQHLDIKCYEPMVLEKGGKFEREFTVTGNPILIQIPIVLRLKGNEDLMIQTVVPVYMSTN